MDSIKLKNEKLVVCVDCVLGLPQELEISWRDAIKQIQKMDGFGRQKAQVFFSTLSDQKDLKRQIEIHCKAQSVFQEKPFQKNIQTGTYRIWKEISISSDDFAVPFLNENTHEHQIPIYEGYPSLSWKLLFGLKSRAPDRLPKLITEQFSDLMISSEDLKLLKKDPNLADAFVLAYSIMKFPKTHPKNSLSNKEGWILGFEKSNFKQH